MNWDELTAPEFAKAVKEVKGVCVVCVGVVEKHHDHLPLGTDFLNGHKICTMAAQEESAIVFPHYFFGQILEARCFPGTIALDPILTLQLLLAVCEEISRNGLNKIIIYLSHGGNKSLLGYLAQSLLAKRYPFAVFCPPMVVGPERKKQWNSILETTVNFHAAETETSIMLNNFPELVKMDAIKGKAEPLGRFKHIPESMAISADWYADYPEHYAGDANKASKEKGVKLRSILVDGLAEYIRAVKNDNTVLDLMREFYDRVDQVGK